MTEKTLRRTFPVILNEATGGVKDLKHLPGVLPGFPTQILRFAQNDREDALYQILRFAQNDREDALYQILRCAQNDKRRRS